MISPYKFHKSPALAEQPLYRKQQPYNLTLEESPICVAFKLPSKLAEALAALTNLTCLNYYRRNGPLEPDMSNKYFRKNPL